MQIQQSLYLSLVRTCQKHLVYTFSSFLKIVVQTNMCRFINQKLKSMGNKIKSIGINVHLVQLISAVIILKLKSNLIFLDQMHQAITRILDLSLQQWELCRQLHKVKIQPYQYKVKVKVQWSFVKLILKNDTPSWNMSLEDVILM